MLTREIALRMDGYGHPHLVKAELFVLPQEGLDPTFGVPALAAAPPQANRVSRDWVGEEGGFAPILHQEACAAGTPLERVRHEIQGEWVGRALANPSRVWGVSGQLVNDIGQTPFTSQSGDSNNFTVLKTPQSRGFSYFQCSGF